MARSERPAEWRGRLRGKRARAATLLRGDGVGGWARSNMMSFRRRSLVEDLGYVPAEDVELPENLGSPLAPKASRAFQSTPTPPPGGPTPAPGGSTGTSPMPNLSSSLTPVPRPPTPPGGKVIAPPAMTHLTEEALVAERAAVERLQREQVRPPETVRNQHRTESPLIHAAGPF